MREHVLAGVRKAIATHGLIQPGEGVVVAVSGGADSVVLLHCLLRLRAEFSLTLHVAHYDHRLRESSRRDALFVQDLAASCGLPATTGSWVREVRRGRSLQAEARRARFHFLHQLASQVGATKIALGHHRDDQAETVLLHLLRGSGLRGLRGMLALKEGRVIRPLLAVGREDIEVYAKTYQLSFVEDPSNRDLRYVRNRIRLELLPLLEREYNPSITKTLARMAGFVAEDEAYLEGVAREICAPMLDVQEGRICMELRSLRGLAPAIRRRVLERAIRRMTPEAYITSAHLAAVERLIAPGGLSEVTLPRGQWAWRAGDSLFVGKRKQEERPPIHLHQELRVPGENVLDEWGIKLEATILPRAMIDPSSASPDRAMIDWSHVVRPLQVRSWRPGDRFRPWGLRGGKKLQDLFVDAKIPQAERKRVPIVTDQKGILWVPGFRIDERGGVGDTTAEVLVLAVHRREGAVAP
ncbi:MAG: tRNA lysidine(34) synthetase TilS [Candidatus Methylomirabilales bacterium]